MRMLKLKTGSNAGSGTLTHDPTRADAAKIADPVTRRPGSICGVNNLPRVVMLSRRDRSSRTGDVWIASSTTSLLRVTPHHPGKLLS